MGNYPSELLKRPVEQEPLSVVLGRVVVTGGLRAAWEREVDGGNLLLALDMVIEGVAELEAGQPVADLSFVCAVAEWLVHAVDRRCFNVAWALLEYAWSAFRYALLGQNIVRVAIWG